MSSTSPKKQMVLAIACALALGPTANLARADYNPEHTGYLTDQRTTVVKSGFGLCWHTGTGPAPASTAECDPDYVAPVALAPAKAAAPVIVAAVAPAPAPKPVGARVTLDADMLFDFDKAVLRPAGRAALDDFLAKSKDIDPEVIMAVGHADRFGSERYNQQLSEQRVAAVSSYLLGKGVAANRLHSEGRGESQPLTKPGECLGAKSAKVIACLQQDRRVDIEVVGNSIVR